MKGDAEVHVAGMVQGDAHIPAFRGIDLGEPGGKVAVVELQGGFAESKATAGLHQRVPTFIHSVGDLDGSFQLADGEVGVQGAAEHSAEDYATSGVELLISEVLDGEPDDGTEGDQREAAEVLAGRTEDERETGDNSGGGIEDIGDAARGEAAGQETMMDMAAVRAKDGLVTEKAPRDGEGGIEEGDGQRNEGSGHAEEGDGFLGPDDAEASEEEADRQATAIAHKDGRGAKVVGEKSEEGAEKGSGHKSQGDVAGEEGAQEGGGCGKQAHAGGEAIEAIDEIKGVGTSDEPKHGERDVPPGVCQGVAGDTEDLDVGVAGQGGGGDLAEDLHPWLEAEDVIEETRSEGDEDGRQKGPEGKRGPRDRVRVPQRREADQGKGDCIAQENGDATRPGDGSAVELAGVGFVHPADARAQGAARRGEGQREQECVSRAY